MSTTTYFGDVATTGNTNLVQKLTVLGAYSYFASNIVGGQSIGTATTPFGFLYASSANTTTMNVGSIQTASATFGNVFSSNAYQGGNLFAVAVNVYGTSNVTSLAVSSNIGTGGANLTVQGNVYVSNVVATPNLIATAMNVSRITNVQSLIALSNIGIGGANLNVTGNAWFSNSLQTGNLYTATLNTGTMNTLTLLASNIGVGTIAAGNAMSVSGNIFVSNSVTVTNIVAVSVRTTNINVATMNLTSVVVSGTANIPQTVNTTTLNVLSIYTPSGFLGINTSAGTGANLPVTGNVFASNAFSGGNLATSGTIYYNEDLTNRSIHLLPSAANATAIQSWISATCNAASKPSSSYWCTSQTPIYGNVVMGSQGGAAYSGGVYLPDGRVVLVPYGSSNIGIYNPQTLQLTSISGTGIAPENFKGGVLLPNGNVVFCPQNSNVGLFNPVTYKFSNSVALPTGAYNGVLTSNSVIFIPNFTPSNIIKYDYTSGAYSNLFSYPAPLPAQYGGWIYIPSAPSSQWTDIKWAPELSLFVAFSASYLTAPIFSKDGTNWTSTATTFNYLGSGAWSPELGIFAAASGNDGTVTPVAAFAYSTNGIDWVASPSTLYSGWNKVAWSPQLRLFVAVGAQYSGPTPSLGYSIDGINWTAGTGSAGSDNFHDVAWSPQLGLFVAVGEAYTRTAVYSTDGINWMNTTTPPGGASGMQGIAWSPQLRMFVATCNGNSGGAYLWWSNDGKNWSTATTDLTKNWRGVTWSPQVNAFIAVAQYVGGGFGTDTLVGYSTDGKNWYDVDTYIMPTPGSEQWSSVVWSPKLGKFIAVGQGDPWLMRGNYNYGIQVKTFLTPIVDIGLPSWNSVIYNSTSAKHIAVGTGSPDRSAYSSDGRTWSNPTTSLQSVDTGCSWGSLGFGSVTSLGTVTVAVGGGGTKNVGYSSDGGVNWYDWPTQSLESFDSGTYWTGVAMAGGYAVACGFGSGTKLSAWSLGVGWFVPTNPNGTALTLYDVDPTCSWCGMVYLPSYTRVVVVGRDGSAGNSAFAQTGGPNRYSFFASNPGASIVDIIGNPWAVTSLGNRCIAVGDNGAALTDDGQNWYPDGYSGASLGSRGFGWNAVSTSSTLGGYTIAVSQYGTVAYTADGGGSWQIFLSDISPYISLDSVGYGYNRIGNDVIVAAFSGTYNSIRLAQVILSASENASTGSALTPTGNVVFANPASSNLVQFNPVSLTIANTAITSYSSSGMVLAPNGKVICTPMTSSSLFIYDTTNRTTTTVSVSSADYQGGVLLPTGNVLMIPGISSNIGFFNPVNSTFSTSTSLATSNIMDFSGGTLLPSGQVVLCPSNVTNVVVLDTFTPAPQELCLSPYFNKGL